MKKGIIAFFAVLIFSLPVFRQTATLSAQPVTTCENSNFNLGTFKGWTGCYGYFGNTQLPGYPAPPDHKPCEVQGFLVIPQPPLYDNPLHKIISAPGWYDANTCGALPLVFPGEDYSVRIGDTAYTSGMWNTGKEAEMKYAVTVSNDSYLFIYRYAVVLQNGGHDSLAQPDFRVELTNADGDVLDSVCGYYYIYAPQGQIWPGWHTCVNNISYKDWTTVGMDLSPYFGQTVYINFKVRGCYYDTHFGYAMLSAYCGYLQIQTALCEGDTSATLTAPPGFTYLWSTGDTTQAITVPNPVTGAQYSCTLTAVNGCEVIITVNLTYTVIHSNFTYGVACAGNPVQFTDSSWVNQNWVENWIWDYGDGTPADTGIANPQHTFAIPGTYDVKLVSFSTEGCLDSIVKQIHVDSIPSITTTPLSDTVCSGAGTNLALTANLPGALYTWTATSNSSFITGYSDNTVPAATINQVLVNTGPVPDTVFYTVYPFAGDCPGPDTLFRFIVNPLPVLIDPTYLKSICDSNSTAITLASNNDSTLFTWTCTASSPNLSGYASNTTTPGTVINQVIDNTGYTTDTVYYHIVGHSYGCNGDTTIFKVAVHPTPDLSNSPLHDSTCTNTSTNITLTSHVAGAQFTWTCTASSGNITGFSNNAIPTTILNQVLVNTGLSIEWVTYHITPTANGCLGDITDFTMYVSPMPVVTNNPMNQSQCSGVNTNINLTGNLPGMTFTWTCTPSSGNITGCTNNGVPGTVINDVLVNAGATLGWATYHVAPTSGGCTGTPMDYTVNVYPVPLLTNSPPAKSQCSNVNTNITLTSNVAGTLFTWTCTPSSGNITGWGNNNVPTTLLNQVLVNTGYAVEWATYEVAPTSNGCPGPVTDYVVTVFPVPDVSNSPLSQSQCSNVNTNINLTSDVAGTLFTWTVTPSSANITGWANNAVPALVINDVLVNTGFNTEWATYEVAPTANGCPGPHSNYMVTVLPTPNLSNSPLSQSQCNNMPTNITLTSNVAGTLFTWTVTPSSANITGWANNAVPGILINDVLVNTGYTVEWATYQVAPTANGCVGPVTNYTVTVFPVANVIFSPNGQSFCSGLTSSINLLSNVAGTTFTWTATGSGPSLSGYGPGSGNLIQQTLTNSGPNPQWATYQVAPTANGCAGTTGSVDVTVNPLPAVTFTPCFDTKMTISSQPVTLKGGIPLGGSYSGAGVNAGRFFPNLAGMGNHIITYTYTNIWTCISTATATVTVVAPVPFACGSNLTDIRDNQVYPTIQIGGQCWLAANLNYGNIISSALMQRDNCIPEKYCFNDNPGNCATLGGMYQWDEMMHYVTTAGTQGFCPPEWHVPTEAEWNALFSVYISNGFAGSPLKFTGYSGFNALLSGTRFNNVQWDFSGFAAMFWSSSAHSQYKAWAHGMNSFNPSVSLYPSHRNNAFWLRCIHN